MRWTGTSPSGQARRGETIESMLAEVDGLPDRQREAVTMAFIDELETAQIGGHLRISRAAVGMLVLRGVRALRDRMSHVGRELA